MILVKYFDFDKNTMVEREMTYVQFVEEFYTPQPMQTMEEFLKWAIRQSTCKII